MDELFFCGFPKQCFLCNFVEGGGGGRGGEDEGEKNYVKDGSKRLHGAGRIV